MASSGPDVLNGSKSIFETAAQASLVPQSGPFLARAPCPESFDQSTGGDVLPRIDLANYPERFLG